MKVQELAGRSGVPQVFIEENIKEYEKVYEQEGDKVIDYIIGEYILYKKVEEYDIEKEFEYPDLKMIY